MVNVRKNCVYAQCIQWLYASTSYRSQSHKSYISLLSKTYRLLNCHFSHSILIITISVRALKKCGWCHFITCLLYVMARSKTEFKVNSTRHGKRTRTCTLDLHYLTIIGFVVYVLRFVSALAQKPVKKNCISIFGCMQCTLMAHVYNIIVYFFACYFLLLSLTEIVPFYACLRFF